MAGAALSSEAEKALESVSPGAAHRLQLPDVALLLFQVHPGFGVCRCEPLRLTDSDVPSGVEGRGLRHKSTSAADRPCSFLTGTMTFI